MSKSMNFFIALLFLALAIAPLAAQENTPAEYRTRGAFLRTEVVKEERHQVAACRLGFTGEDPIPALQMATREIRTIREVRLYETRLCRFVPDDSGNRGSFQFSPLPNEIWRGEEITRQEPGAVKTLVYQSLTVNGVPCRTNKEGYIVNRDGTLYDLLSPLDNLGKRTLKLQILIPDCPPLEYVVYRTMPQRNPNDEKRLEEPAEQDLLLACGLNFQLSRQKPEQERLHCTVKTSVPGNILIAGRPFTVTITVENRGDAPTSCLLARSFSRIPGLNGKLFYFGAIPPGKSASFTRYMTVDANSTPSRAFAEIRFSDSWSIPQHKLPLQFTVVHQ